MVVEWMLLCGFRVGGFCWLDGCGMGAGSRDELDGCSFALGGLLCWFCAGFVFAFFGLLGVVSVL